MFEDHSLLHFLTDEFINGILPVTGILFLGFPFKL